MTPALRRRLPCSSRRERRRHQTGLDPVELRTWVPQPGDLDDRRLAKSQARAGR